MRYFSFNVSKKKYTKLLIFLLLQLLIRTGSLYPQTEPPGYSGQEKFQMIIQKGHTYQINSVAISPDGRFIATVGSILKLWKPDGTLVRNIKWPSLVIESVSFSPSGRYIITGSQDKTIRVWSLSGELVKTIHAEEKIRSIAVSPQENHIAGLGDNGAVYIWDFNGNPISHFIHVDVEKIKENLSIEERMDFIFKKLLFSGSVVFSPDGKFLATSAKNNVVKIWSLDGKLIRTLIGHEDWVSDLAFSPNGKYLASASWDKTIILWTAGGVRLHTFARHTDGVNTVAFSPTGKIIASGGKDKTINFWSIDGRFISTFTKHNGSVNDLAISPDWNYIASGDSDRYLFIWSMTEGFLKPLPGYSGNIKSIDISPDGKYIVSGSVDKKIRLWSITGSLQKTLRGHEGSITTVAFSPDNKYVASGSWDKSVRIWSIDGALLQILRGHNAPVLTVSYHPDGNLLLSGDREGFINIWDINGQLIRSIRNSEGSIRDITVNLDGKSFACTASDKKIRLWTLDGDLINVLRNNFSKKVWTPSVAFGPEGIIAGGSADETIKIWNKSGKLINILQGHTRPITSLSFSPDEKYLASTSIDGSIKLWDYKKGKLLHTFHVHLGATLKVVFGLDGKYMVSCDDGNLINIWNVKDFNYVSLFSDGDEWIIYTQDGYFDASRYGGVNIRMTSGIDAYAVDQFAIRNNRPDIILERLDYGDRDLIHYYYRLYKRRLLKLGLKEKQLTDEYYVPTAEINEVKVKADRNIAEVSFSLKDSRYKIIKYNIYVNDVPLYGAGGKNIDGYDLDLVETIELTGGVNKIEVSCINEKGSESFRALRQVISKQNTKGDLYFIGFGVSDYQNKSLNLKYADDDVRDLAGVFRRMEGLYFNKVHIKTYLNKDVTVQNIISAKQILQNAKANDTLVAFVSGHGIYTNDIDAKYYYLTYDADIKKITETCADFELIENIFQGIKPRKKLLLMDTCESGEIENQTRQQYYSLAETKSLRTRTSKGIIVVQRSQNQSKPRKHLYAMIA